MKYSKNFYYVRKHDELIWTNLLTGLNSIGASSDKCDNFKNVRIVDSLWYENILRGVSLLPKMQLSVTEWTAFTMKSPHFNPLFCSKTHLTEDIDDSDVVYILLETGIYPDIHAITSGSTILAVNKFWFTNLENWKPYSLVPFNRRNDLALRWRGNSTHVWLLFYNQTFPYLPSSLDKRLCKITYW